MRRCLCESHLAAILHHAVCKSAVTLCSDFHIVGALQQKSLLQVASGFIHVRHAVLAVVGDALRGLARKQSQEVHLDAGHIWSRDLLTIAELYQRQRE